MSDDLHLQEKSLEYLVAFRAVVVSFGYTELTREITAELDRRGYTLPCSCKELAGDDPDCVVHHPAAA